MGIFDRFKKDKEQVKKGSVAKKVTDAQDKKSTPAKKKQTKTSGKKRAGKKEKQAGRLASRRATSILLAPVVSEKTAQLSDSNTLVFRVASDANRVAIRQAFKELYKVTPKKVNTMNVRGKRVRFGRHYGKRSDYKKALITLPEGAKVDIFEGV